MIKVQIIGALVACQQENKDSWRDLANYMKRQLYARFHEDVVVEYYDLFDKECPSFPKDAKIPVVIIDGKLFSSGGKISVPLIRSFIEKKMNLDKRI